MLHVTLTLLSNSGQEGVSQPMGYGVCMQLIVCSVEVSVE